jgi:SAM-dependent methyltransferase
MEKLPFASSTFDMVVSQWGLEYSNLETSVAELLRVLVPGGRVQFLIHHTGALPVVLAGHEVAHLDWLESESGYLDVVAQMVEPMAIAATPEGRGRLALDPHAHDLKEAFNFQQDAIQLRIDRTDCTDVLFDVRQFVGTLFLIAQRHGFLAASSALQKIRAELADSRLRLSELIQHAMDRAAVNVLATSLAVGGEYHVDELRDQDAIMSWSLVASPQLPSG